jgi:hypothetical protein
VHAVEVESCRSAARWCRALTWEAMHGPDGLGPATLHAAEFPGYYGMTGSQVATRADLCFRAFAETNATRLEVRIRLAGRGEGRQPWSRLPACLPACLSPSVERTSGVAVRPSMQMHTVIERGLGTRADCD